MNLDMEINFDFLFWNIFLNSEHTFFSLNSVYSSILQPQLETGDKSKFL